MPKHIVNLLILLGGILLLAFAVRFYLVDPSFYKFGHYRSDSVPELAAATPLYQGSAYCRTCHTERDADWAIGTHRTVQCEVCHGTDRSHPDDGKSLVPTDKIKLCTTCHLATTGRPARQPQIVLGQHPFPDEDTPQCHTCHDPHAPADMQTDATALDAQTQAAGTNGASSNAPAITSKCAKCHGQSGEGVKKNPALAGLVPAVFIERIELYKSGAREHKIMTKLARSLSDEEIAELAEYYNNLAAKPSQ